MLFSAFRVGECRYVHAGDCIAAVMSLGDEYTAFPLRRMFALLLCSLRARGRTMQLHNDEFDVLIAQITARRTKASFERFVAGMTAYAAKHLAEGADNAFTSFKQCLFAHCHAHDTAEDGYIPASLLHSVATELIGADPQPQHPLHWVPFDTSGDKAHRFAEAALRDTPAAREERRLAAFEEACKAQYLQYCRDTSDSGSARSVYHSGDVFGDLHTPAFTPPAPDVEEVDETVTHHGITQSYAPSFFTTSYTPHQATEFLCACVGFSGKKVSRQRYSDALGAVSAALVRCHMEQCRLRSTRAPPHLRPTQDTESSSTPAVLQDALQMRCLRCRHVSSNVTAEGTTRFVQTPFDAWCGRCGVAHGDFTLLRGKEVYDALRPRARKPRKRRQVLIEFHAPPPKPRMAGCIARHISSARKTLSVLGGLTAAKRPRSNVLRACPSCARTLLSMDPHGKALAYPPPTSGRTVPLTCPGCGHEAPASSWQEVDLHEKLAADENDLFFSGGVVAGRGKGGAAGTLLGAGLAPHPPS